jgi:drug/metabolite transporter (DMT)-like permease
MENITQPQETLTSFHNSNQEVPAQELGLPKLVIVILIAIWLFYIPAAYFLFLFSLMASDSGPMSPVTVGLVALINLAPFAGMSTVTYFALRKKSVVVALIPVIVVIGFEFLTNIFR